MIKVVKQVLQGRPVSILAIFGPSLFLLLDEYDLLDSPYHSQVSVGEIAEKAAGVWGARCLECLLKEATHHLKVNTNEQGPSPSALVHIYHTNLPMR